MRRRGAPQIEADAALGKVDALASAAVQDYERGWHKVSFDSGDLNDRRGQRSRYNGI